MAAEVGHQEGSHPTGREPTLTRVLEWVRQQIGLQSDPLLGFTEGLLSRFRTGIEIPHPCTGTWFATIDALNSRDEQVAAVVRVSRNRSTPPKDVSGRMVGFGQRGRIRFAEPVGAQAIDADILLAYSFMPLFSLDGNLRLFVEFVTNEIGRLRGKPSEEIRTNSDSE